MRSRLMTQWGQRLIRKRRKWVKPSEVEARVWRDMEGWGANHDTLLVELGAELVILLPKGTNFVLELQELLLAPIT